MRRLTRIRITTLRDDRGASAQRQETQIGRTGRRRFAHEEFRLYFLVFLDPDPGLVIHASNLVSGTL